MGSFRDLTGHRFERWTVLAYRPPKWWLCRCDCGVERGVRASDLNSGRSGSCGCLHREIATQSAQVHGQHDHPLYQMWCGMIARCENPRHKSYANYGGRGIRVCDRWRESFAAFLEDVGDRTFPAAELDRFPDKNGDYRPGNVRWTTPKRNSRNRRGNVVLEHAGQQLCVTEWAERVGMDKSTLNGRLLRGWPVDRALTTPVGPRKWTKRATA